MAEHKIEQRPGVPNFDKGRMNFSDPTKAIKAICDHIMSGSLKNTDDWFHNPASQVSAHYGIGRKGEIYQWVKDEDTAWANGMAYEASGAPYITDGTTGQHLPLHPDMSIGWLKSAVQNRVNPNIVTISIEHECVLVNGVWVFQQTDAMYAATLWLHQQLVNTYGIVPSPEFIMRHSQINTAQRAGCPGPKFPFASLFADLTPPSPIVPITTPYSVTISSPVTIRKGPSRDDDIVRNVLLDGSKQYTVVREQHGEPVWDNKRRRYDDVWIYFDDIEGFKGFVTRTAADNLPGE